MSLEPRTLVAGFINLTTLPEIYQLVREHIDDPNYSTQGLGILINKDPALTARLLKIVNSPYYGFPMQIDTIPRAITLLGTRELCDLILATSISRLFNGIPNDLMDMETFWRHSVYTAIIARLLARNINQHNTQERCFLVGLLHDIGSLLIYNKLPELARETLLRSQLHGLPLQQTEMDVLGFDHAQVGAALLTAWRLPDNLVTAVAFHHQPEAATEHRIYAEIAYLANQLANLGPHGAHNTPDVKDFNAIKWSLPGLKKSQLKNILTQANEEFDATVQMFLPDYNDQLTG